MRVRNTRISRWCLLLFSTVFLASGCGSKAPNGTNGDDDATTGTGDDDTTLNPGDDDATSGQGDDDASSEPGDDDATTGTGDDDATGSSDDKVLGSEQDETTPRPACDMSGGPDDLGPDLSGKCAPGCTIDVLTQRISADVTWSCGQGTYHLSSDLHIDQNATLTLAPGATVSFDPEVSLEVGNSTSGAALVAKGTLEAPIKFTSYLAAPNPGDWGAILLEWSSVNTALDYVTIEYGGHYSKAGLSPGDGAVQMVGDPSTGNMGKVSLTHTTFRHNAPYALVLRYGAGPEVFHNNAFTDNGPGPIYVESGVVGMLQGPNSFDPDNRILVPQGSVAYTATWYPLGAPFLIAGPLTVGGRHSPTLTLAPGVTLLFNHGSSLLVGKGGVGALVADGTSKAITFGSAQSSPSAGDWEGIILDASVDAGLTRVTGARFEYCGAASSAGSAPVQACLGVIDSSPTITNNTFTSYSGKAIQLVGTANPTLSGNKE